MSILNAATRLPFALDKPRLAALCRQFHVRKLAFFGSVLRPDFGLNSDVDILVEFEPGKVPGLQFFTLQEELSKLFGRKVDLNTPKSLPTLFRSEALAGAQTQYEQT